MLLVDLYLIWLLTKTTCINSVISKITFTSFWTPKFKLYFFFLFWHLWWLFSDGWVNLLLRPAILRQDILPVSGECYSTGVIASCLCCFVPWNSQHCGALKCTISNKQYYQGSFVLVCLSFWTSYFDTMSQYSLHAYLSSWEWLCPVT